MVAAEQADVPEDEDVEQEDDAIERLPAPLRAALAAKGYKTLTAVQRAVLDPAVAGRDLRISSQTGSGKTVAVAFVIADLVAEGVEPTKPGIARPRVIMITPTRELAAQVQGELGWALAGLGAKVAVVAGGASYRTESRALAQGPRVVVGTPGRLLDHLERGGIATDAVLGIVLDEADQMLDLGFRESLKAILARMPAERRTHLVSATFSADVMALAQRHQRDGVAVEGTRLGAANTDIEHVVHLVPDQQRTAALVNILLAHPEDQTLVFARTRAEVGELADELRESGFAVASLSGEMMQEARNAALAAFRSGKLRVLVATDVAARGIDVQDIARVIQVSPPGSAESYVHRSGRTGRAGRKGASVLLMPASLYPRTQHVLRRAGIKPRVEPVPTAADILRAADDRLFAELVAEPAAPQVEGEAAPATDPRLDALAARLLAHPNATAVVARLLARAHHAGPTAPRVVHSLAAFAPRPSSSAHEPRHEAGRRDSGRGAGREGGYDRGRESRYDRGRDTGREAARDGGREPRGPVRDRVAGPEAWARFGINWGERHGADPRRLLALVCRRGDIRGNEVGAIRIGPIESTFDVARSVAMRFGKNASRRDARDPGLRITAL